MQIGEKCIIHIDSYSHEGHGIGRVFGSASPASPDGSPDPAIPAGFVVMVPGTLRGEDCRITVTGLHKNYAVASLDSVIKPSESRRRPFCPHFSKCGGCDLQHMGPNEENYFKESVLKNALSRIAGLSLDDFEFYPILAMDKPFEYRNIAQYHSDGEGHFGFYARSSNEVVDIDFCPIQSRLTNKIFGSVREFCRENKILFIKHLIIRVSKHKPEEAMLIFILNNGLNSSLNSDVDSVDLFKILSPIVAHVTCKHPECISIYYGSENKNPNKIKYKLISGKERITERIGNLSFSISCRSFFQINPVQTEVLYNRILDFAKLTGGEEVYDLYCGTGAISLYLAANSGHTTGRGRRDRRDGHDRRDDRDSWDDRDSHDGRDGRDDRDNFNDRDFIRITGVELAASAAADARLNAKINKIENVSFIEGKSENLSSLIPDISPDNSAVILDPPRAGCQAKLINTLLKIKPARIIYVSCDPATLARDLKILTAGNAGDSRNLYFVKCVQPVNMFPWTRHVETVVLLQRRDT